MEGLLAPGNVAVSNFGVEAPLAVWAGCKKMAEACALLFPSNQNDVDATERSIWVRTGPQKKTGTGGGVGEKGTVGVTTFAGVCLGWLDGRMKLQGWVRLSETGKQRCDSLDHLLPTL